MIDSPLHQWLNKLETLHPNEIDLGLERVAEVAGRMQLLEVYVPVFTIAGTNGKGSTAAVLESVLTGLGRRCGLCTSPHFLAFNERIRVASVPVTDELIVKAFESIELARGDISLTYFEFATLAALQVFRKARVDCMILEVGLGGRLDAVNIIDPTVAIITSIALDHQEWLGESRSKIALEKAGILRAGVPAVIADEDPPQSLRDQVSSLAADACYFGEDFSLQVGDHQWQGTLRDNYGQSRKLPLIDRGSILPVNICAALQALLLAGVKYTDAQLLEALSAVKLAGRRESLDYRGNRLILDVAHNPAAVSKLLEYIDVTPCNGKIFALFSLMSDKDLHGIVSACKSRFDGWFLADQPDNPRAASAAKIQTVLHEYGETVLEVSGQLEVAFDRAQEYLRPGDTLLAFGSFFTVASVMQQIAGSDAEVAQ